MIAPVTAIVGKAGGATEETGAIASVRNNATSALGSGAHALSTEIAPLAIRQGGFIDAGGARREVTARAGAR